MEAIDTYTAELFSLNKDVRVRVGNPDEMLACPTQVAQF
jgi:phosphoketolase